MTYENAWMSSSDRIMRCLLLKHFTWHSSSRQDLPLTTEINWGNLATQHAIGGAFICSSAPHTMPIKTDNAIIKKSWQARAVRETLPTAAICYTSRITMLPPFMTHKISVETINFVQISVDKVSVEGQLEWGVSENHDKTRLRPETRLSSRQKITAMSWCLSLSSPLKHTMIYYLKRQEN